jgi:hypothetical protein
MKPIYCLPVFLLTLLYCTAPRVFAQIVPEAPEGHYANGREYIPLESDQIAVELGYDGLQGTYLVFDLVVHNGTEDTLLLRPGDFYYVTLDSADAEAAPHTPWMAVHPDKVLMQYDRVLEEKEEAKKVNSVFGWIEAGVRVLYNTTGFIATRDPGFIADAVLQSVGTADHYVTQDQAIRSALDIISAEKALVEEELFRTCKVPPGMVTSGYVFFPRHDQTPYYMFCFPVQNQLFQFVYNQPKEFVYN